MVSIWILLDSAGEEIPGNGSSSLQEKPWYSLIFLGESREGINHETRIGVESRYKGEEVENGEKMELGEEDWK